MYSFHLLIPPQDAEGNRQHCGRYQSGEFKRAGPDQCSSDSVQEGTAEAFCAASDMCLYPTMSDYFVFSNIFAGSDHYTELLYDTAAHGATNKAFHDACDYKGPTIGVFTSDEEAHVWGW